MKRLILRIPIRVSTFDKETGKMVNISTYTRKAQLIKFVQLQTASKDEISTHHVAKVMYNRDGDYSNEFEFNTLKEFKEKLEPCLESDLLRDLLSSGTLNKEYVAGL